MIDSKLRENLQSFIESEGKLYSFVSELKTPTRILEEVR